jgi:two-component sensor histidine kinase
MALQPSAPGSAATVGAATSALAGMARLLRRRGRTPAPKQDADLRYRTLFECVSDGFALVRVIRDAAGHVSDYIILEANPALLRLFGWTTSPVGKRQSELVGQSPFGWLKACDTAMRGQPLTFEFQGRSGRWFEIHLSRITDDQLAHIIVEITARKQAEQRQAEMFDELNHRVKNNLAIVSAMLSMQARAAGSSEVREQLMAAVERIQTIADVHATLYRTGRKDEVDFAVYLTDLCNRLRGSVLDASRISLTLKAQPAYLPLDRAVALGVLVNELVTNAAKHAYPPPRHGTIAIALEEAPQSLVLSVGDDGPGLPAEPPDSGLGMRLVRSMVQQLGASLQVDCRPGATFHVCVPHEARPEPEDGQNLLI